MDPNSNLPSRRLTPLVFMRRHQSIVVGVVVGIAVFLLTSAVWSTDNLLTSWVAGAVVYVVLTWRRMLTASVTRIRHRAADLDSSDVVLLILASGATLASMGGIAVELHGLKDAGASEALWRGGLAAATILISWLFLHTLFTVHYAHGYYAGQDGGGGLKFPDNPQEPVFWDFLYFSFTIGVAAQTADVSVTSMPMRRLVLLHSAVSFFFNTTILALAVNVGASIV
ncbi:MAG: hypothetical protein BGO05_16550 [Rhizobiales bacterium 63-7]|uniref:DUF1345 domain-containing protein n=1 Tax=Rhizobium sp. YJ-22 TaxID=3037556 RepID=UPI0009262B3B|nr:DUF1345 domain-containing protein [Rhizobium sp. YJ-22]MBN9030076.1 DUF1345 domain-containing protein [Hyphomicrobiales bacterium]MDG3578869.1 DUF1345 domain-containing protein [Rhizobium sp. YJ-22]OJU68397.1 MAG: hypothetical protein BGO05_16550 [Rhizobiales bacterium 63-7]